MPKKNKYKEINALLDALKPFLKELVPNSYLSAMKAAQISEQLEDKYLGKSLFSIMEKANHSFKNGAPSLDVVLKLALKAGVSVDSVDSKGWTYLMDKCRRAYPFPNMNERDQSKYDFEKYLIQILIENGANVNYQSSLSIPDYKIYNNEKDPANSGPFGHYTFNPYVHDTPLTIAVLNEGNEDVLKILLDAGADRNIASDRGTPLQIAKEVGNRKNAEFLEKYIGEKHDRSRR